MHILMYFVASIFSFTNVPKLSNESSSGRDRNQPGEEPGLDAPGLPPIDQRRLGLEPERGLATRLTGFQLDDLFDGLRWPLGRNVDRDRPRRSMGRRPRGHPVSARGQRTPKFPGRRRCDGLIDAFDDYLRRHISISFMSIMTITSLIIGWAEMGTK